MMRTVALGIIASVCLLSCSPPIVESKKSIGERPPAPESRWVSGTQVPNGYLFDVFFVDEQIGWAVGGNRIANTSDGGRTWTERRNLGGEEDYWNGIWFLDRNRGFAVGGLAAPEESRPPKIIATEDGGKTWMDRTPEDMKGAVQRCFDRIQFVSPTEGFIFGDRLLATKDAGKSWSFVGSEKRVYGRSCTFSSAAVGWRLDRNLLKTVDGGESWKPTALWDALPEEVQSHGALNSVRFMSDLVGCVMTSGAVFWRTEDGGRTWKVLGEVPVWRVRDIVFTDLTTGWVISHNSDRSFILRTNDGGLIWENSLETDPGLTRLFFLRQDLGWAVGYDMVFRYGGSP